MATKSPTAGQGDQKQHGHVWEAETQSGNLLMAGLPRLGRLFARSVITGDWDLFGPTQWRSCVRPLLQNLLFLVDSPFYPISVLSSRTIAAVAMIGKKCKVGTYLANLILSVPAAHLKWWWIGFENV